MEPSKHFLLTRFVLFSVLIQNVKPQNDEVLKIRQNVDMRRKVLDLSSKLHALQEQFTSRQRNIWRIASGTHKQQRDIWEAATGIGEGKLRLMDGSRDLEGRLEVFHDGQWGTVCDDDFSIDDARVACRQMGYSGGNYMRYYKAGSGRIWMSNLRCQGTETRITDCRFGGWGDHSCRHWQDVAISCDMPPETNSNEEDEDAPCDITAAMECFDLLNMSNRRSFTRASRRCSSTYPMFLSCVDGLQFACRSGPLGAQIAEEREAIVNICGNTGH